MSECIVLPLEIQPQPDDVTCGPTCLHAVYRHLGDDVSLAEVIRTSPQLRGPDGEANRGTLAVMLGCHALDRGYRAELYTYNVRVFDPTWFPDDERRPADSAHLRERLVAQAAFKRRDDPGLALATEWYLRFLDGGGRILLRDLSGSLVARFLRRGLPVLTGLNSTYLYHSAREFGPNDDEDDVRGEPVGHFVVLCGYDAAHRRVRVADPLRDNPAFNDHVYEVGMNRLLASIMLGALTHDANLLVLEREPHGAAPT